MSRCLLELLLFHLVLSLPEDLPVLDLQTHQWVLLVLALPVPPQPRTDQDPLTDQRTLYHPAHRSDPPDQRVLQTR